MKTSVSLGLTLADKTPRSLDSHFCEVGVPSTSKFPDSYSLTSKTEWIHSCTKHFSLSQNLNFIMWFNTVYFCTNTAPSVSWKVSLDIFCLSGNQLSVHIKAQFLFSVIKTSLLSYLTDYH